MRNQRSLYFIPTSEDIEIILITLFYITTLFMLQVYAVEERLSKELVASFRTRPEFF